MSIELVITILASIGLFFILIQSMKLNKLKKEIQQQGKLFATIKQEMNALLLCERGMGTRIKQQQQVRTVIERQDKLEISDGANTSYKQAMVLLQKGASTDELIEACVLSRGELELLSRLRVAAAATPTSRVA